MPFAQILKISIRALKVNKVRSALTMLGVIIGVASVILLVSLGVGLQKYIKDQLEGIGSNLLIVMPGKIDFKKMGQGGAAGMLSTKLKISDARSLENNSSLIKKAIAMTTTQGIFKYNDNQTTAQLVGVEADFNSVINSPLALGDYFTEADNRGGRKVVILGARIAKDLFGEDDPLGTKITISGKKFEVIGVLKNNALGSSNIEDHAVIPLVTAQRFSNIDNINGIYAQVVSSDKMDLAIEESKRALLDRLNEDDFTVLTQKDLLGAVSSILGMLTLALAGIAAISLLVGGIGIMNIMLVSVSERTKEIGLRKALGATPNIILTQFLIEAVILSVGGGIIGILVGAGGSLILSKFITTSITWWAILLSFGISVGIGIIFGVMPARRASRLSPIEALRYE